MSTPKTVQNEAEGVRLSPLTIPDGPPAAARAAVSKFEQAVQAAHEAAQAVERWRSEVEATLALIDRTEAGMGAEAVKNPERLHDLAGQLDGARARLSVARAAVPEAEDQHALAVAAACRLEADELEPERVKAVKALEAHQTRTAELLEALREHTGAEWRRIGMGEFFAANPGGAFEEGVDAPLRRAVTAVERKQAVLRGVADGKRPHEVLSGACWDDLGVCLRPGGVADAGFTDPQGTGNADDGSLEAARVELDEAGAGMAFADHRMASEPHTVPAEEAWHAARARLSRARGVWFTAADRAGVPKGDVPDLPDRPPAYERVWPPRVEAEASAS